MRNPGRFPIALVTVTVSAIVVAGLLLVGAGQEEASSRRSLAGSRHRAVPQALNPTPGLSPEEVVKYQVAVLAQNDHGDAGIRRCYQFASPLNRAATGPIDSFIRMVRSPPYQVMLQTADTLVGRAVVRNDQGSDWAMVLVTMIDAGRNIRVFRFILSKQRESPYEGCWMTDAVREVTFEGSASPPRESSQAPAVGV